MIVLLLLNNGYLIVFFKINKFFKYSSLEIEIFLSLKLVLF